VRASVAVSSILDAIGKTPLVRLRRCVPENGAGANVVGAHRLAETLGPHAVIVTLAVDSGFKYLSVPPYGDS
jgi:cysteine synthase